MPSLEALCIYAEHVRFDPRHPYYIIERLPTLYIMLPGGCEVVYILMVAIATQTILAVSF